MRQLFCQDICFHAGIRESTQVSSGWQELVRAIAQLLPCFTLWWSGGGLFNRDPQTAPILWFASSYAPFSLFPSFPFSSFLVSAINHKPLFVYPFPLSKCFVDFVPQFGIYDMVAKVISTCIISSVKLIPCHPICVCLTALCYCSFPSSSCCELVRDKQGLATSLHTLTNLYPCACRGVCPVLKVPALDILPQTAAWDAAFCQAWSAARAWEG